MGSNKGSYIPSVRANLNQAKRKTHELLIIVAWHIENLLLSERNKSPSPLTDTILIIILTRMDTLVICFSSAASTMRAKYPLYG